jgi:rhodanese-related sulfurtransferase
MQTLTTEQVRALKADQDGPAIINVLDAQYYRKEHIPDSENIPLSTDNFVEKVEQASGSKSKPVIVYCANTECDASPKAAKKLEQNGFDQVYDYEGGMDAWKEAGLEIAGATADS